jgi:competence protein ComFC
MLYEKFKRLTLKPVCKICFKDFKRESIISFFNEEVPICPECFKKMNYSLSFGRIEGYRIMSLAPYAPPLSELLIRYKETLDYELYGVFISEYASLLKIMYAGFTVVFVPSSPAKLSKRGFDHLEMIFSLLHLKTLKILTKENGIDQKKKNAEDRKKSASLFSIHGGEKVSGRRILLVDDVITSGTSLKACLHLLSPFHPKEIRILVIMNDSPLSSYE